MSLGGTRSRSSTEKPPFQCFYVSFYGLFRLQQCRDWYLVEKPFDNEAQGAPDGAQAAIPGVDATLLIPGEPFAKLDRRKHSTQGPNGLTQVDRVRRSCDSIPATNTADGHGESSASKRM